MKTDDRPVAHIDPLPEADLAPYRLLREIGRGGMSVVYEALDTRAGQRVALKVLALPFSVTAAQRSELVARFRREERAVTQLSHPNIVAIQEIGERTGVHFIAMEYLPGESLRARLERGPLPLPEAGRVLAQIAAALTAVHEAGIVHRDVKPSNIMLLPDGSAKLLDFGVARHSDDTAITSGGLVVGSPAYLAPEQVRGGTGTTASDVWALGVLLYEMLAGRPPFQATDVAAVMYQVIHEPPPPLTGLPPGMAKVLKRALDKTPERRFPSALALSEAFTATLPTERSLSVPVPPRVSGPSVSGPSVSPRWLWATLPVLFVLALVWGFYGRRPAPTLPSRPIAAVPTAAVPTAAVPTAAVPTAAVPTAAVPTAAVPTAAVPSASAPSPKAALAVLPAAPHTNTAPLPSAPLVRHSVAQALPSAPKRHAVRAARRPRPVSVSRPRPASLLAAKPAARPAVHALPPRRPASVVTVSAAPPIEAAAPPPPAQPVSLRPAPPRSKPSKADDDAAGAARLQRFIWSEGR